MSFRARIHLFLLLLSVGCAPLVAHAQLNWDDRFAIPGIVGYDAKLAQDSDGALIVAGLEFINGVAVMPAGVYRDGSWKQLGSYDQTRGIDNVFTWRGGLYGVGRARDEFGIFRYGIARYEQNEWQFLIYGNGEVHALPTDSLLYLYGKFDSLNGQPFRSLAEWNGEKLSSIDLDVTWMQGQYTQDRGITNLISHDNWIYAAGYFTFTDSVTSRNILRFDRSTHKAASLGTGTDKALWDLEWWRGSLYATGEFDNIGGTGAYRIARWNGTSWFPVGSPRDVLSCYQVELATFNDELLVYGGLLSAGREKVSSIASWNGQQWSAKYDRPQRSISSLLISNNTLMASFDSNGLQTEISAFEFDRWQPMTFTLPSSMLGLRMLDERAPQVSSIAATNDHLYVAGNFLCFTPGVDSIKNFARFDGERWYPVLDSSKSTFKLYAHGERLFIAERRKLLELSDDTLTLLREFGSEINTITFADSMIYVGVNYYGSMPSDNATIYKAPLDEIIFERTGAKWNAIAIAVIADRLFYLNNERLYEVQGEANLYIMPAVGNERFNDMIAVGRALYVAGRFVTPFATMMRCYLDAGFVEQPSEHAESYEGRKVVTVGNDVFLTGALDRRNGVLITLARETNGVFALLTDALPIDVAGMASFKGDLYVGGTTGIGAIQSSGIARAILTASKVSSNPAKLKPSVSALVVTDSHLQLAKPAKALYDQLGREVRQLSNETMIDVGDLSTGMYLLHYSDGEIAKVQLVR
jgi:hypothetical protein